MKKITIATLILTVTAGAAFAANGMNNPPPHIDGEHKGGKMMHEHKHQKPDLPRDFEQLDLTDAQKAKIKAIVESDLVVKQIKPDESDFRQKMEAHRAATEKIINNKQFDEAAARQLIVQRQQERLEMEREQGELELQMLRKRHAIFHVLTAEQQKKLQELQQRNMNNFLSRKMR